MSQGMGIWWSGLFLQVAAHCQTEVVLTPRLNSHPESTQKFSEFMLLLLHQIDRHRSTYCTANNFYYVIPHCDAPSTKETKLWEPLVLGQMPGLSLHLFERVYIQSGVRWWHQTEPTTAMRLKAAAAVFKALSHLRLVKVAIFIPF